MRYYPRLKVYKNTNNTNYFDPQTMEATSYNWWVYLKRINGKLIFNNYSYSNSTCKHQNHLWSVLNALNIKPDLVVYQRESLSHGVDLELVYKSAVSNLISGERKGRRLDKALSDLFEYEYQLEKLAYMEKVLNQKVSKKRRAELEKEMREHEAERLEYQRKEAAAQKEAMAPKLEKVKPELESMAPVSLFNDLSDLTEVNI